MTCQFFHRVKYSLGKNIRRGKSFVGAKVSSGQKFRRGKSFVGAKVSSGQKFRRGKSFVGAKVSSGQKFRRGKSFVGAKVSSGKIFAGENFRHLTKISSLFPDEVFPDKVHDPIGILAVLVFLFKILFQNICKARREWDEILPNDLLRMWFTLGESIKIRVSVPRYYFSPHPLIGVTNICLHGFCDASQKGYAAVLYILGKVYNDKVTGSIVMCKTKVAPVKTLSIPKLELLSCLLLSQLMEVLLQMRRILEIERLILWSDSMDSLYWIKGVDKKRTQFVKNKIEKIRALSSHENWRHVPGKINPADLPSRGSTKENEIKSWLSVPEFLQNNRDWPPDISSDEKYRHVHQPSLPMETNLTVLQCHTNDSCKMSAREPNY